VKTTIPVANRKEGDLLRAGLDDPAVRAFVQVMAVLNSLPSDRARQRVLTFVVDKLEEERVA
jgi:hypothetical protein